MRVLAYYGYNDIRDEEWPRPKKLPQNSFRLEIRSLILSDQDRASYKGGLWKKPWLPGLFASGIVCEKGDTTLEEGIPVAVWRENDTMGLSQEFAFATEDTSYAPKEAFDYVSLSLLPLWAQIHSAIPNNLDPKTPCALVGQGPVRQMLEALLKERSQTITSTPKEAQTVFLSEADPDSALIAMTMAAPKASLNILSLAPGASLGTLTLALERQLCFNFGSTLRKDSLKTVSDLAIRQKIDLKSVLAAAMDWDQADSAFSLLETQTSPIALTKARLDEPYFP